MPTDQGVQAVIGFSGFRTDAAGVPLSREHFIRLELPPSFSREHIAMAQRDFELPAKKAAEYPQEVMEVQNAMLAHDFPRATKLSERRRPDAEADPRRGRRRRRGRARRRDRRSPVDRGHRAVG